jgi:acetyl esterase
MKLDRGMREFIRRTDEVFPPDYLSYPVARQRELYRDLCRAFDRPRPVGLTVVEGIVAVGTHQVPIRVYRPRDPARQACLLYLHGGGWVLGDLDSHDGVTAELAATAGLTVIAVDYRLAPEHPYPAAFEDSAAVLERVAADAEAFGIDPARLAVAGDSAGGGLAAALCLQARDRGGPELRGQILIYPALGLDMTGAERSDARDAPLLSRDEMNHYTRAYLGPSGKTDDPYAAPLLAGDFSVLPPAYVQAVEYDPLRADAEAYAARLTEAGVPVELEVASGLVHGCLWARFTSAAAGGAFARLCAATRRLLAAD